jgi:hypothetical protein
MNNKKCLSLEWYVRTQPDELIAKMLCANNGVSYEEIIDSLYERRMMPDINEVEWDAE